jgi:selenocysteine lyase/cysteine desulfurase
MKTEYSNVGRSVHSLAVKATNKFEATRDLAKKIHECSSP